MVKRKKRLEKGIESLEKQIEIHKEKKRVAEENRNNELMSYYDKEIKSLEQTKEDKKSLLKKQ
jgi:hypothetical protein